MRLSEAIRTADELKPNRFTSRQKERWINTLQRRIFNQVLVFRDGAEVYEFEKEDIEGEVSLPVKSVRDEKKIIIPTGPVSKPYPIKGQRIFADNDYFAVTDTDYSFTPYDDLWGIYVAGPVSGTITEIYPASTIFRKGSDELIISGAYEELYLYWLFAKIDYFNRETVSYNNSAVAFNEIYDDYVKSVIRSTMPKTDNKIIIS